MNWGKGIVLAFVLFAVFLAVMITIMMRQDVGLVSQNYYRDDVNFQEQYDRKHNAEQLELKPVISVEQNEFLKVYFPSTSYIEGGTIKLFRPSSEKLDQNFRLTPSADSIQVFRLQHIERGTYRVKMDWKMEGKEFYIEQVIFI
jgi:hypothetical protein